MVTSRRQLWTARLAVGAAITSGALTLASAVAGRSAMARSTGLAACWACWAVLLVAVLTPAVASLTALRLLIPLHLAGVGVMWVAGSEVSRAVPAVLIALVSLAAVFSADTGQAFVQASAYGHEQRFPLRAPVPYLAPLGLAWLAWAALGVSAVLVLGGGRGLAGGILVAGWAGLSWFLWPRWHRFAQRWLVRVPAGLVVHDPVMLGETAMIPTGNVRAAALAREGTEALDLSGPASGHLVEVRVGEMVTMLVRRGSAPASAVHVQSFLVAPSRPGAALSAITRH
jgi:hypothetical protein